MGIPPAPATTRLRSVIAGLPDPLRRAKIPKDLESVTTVGKEADPTDVGMLSLIHI